MKFKSPQFVLGKMYEMYIPAAKALAELGLHFKDTKDYRFTVTDVTTYKLDNIVWSNDIYYTPCKQLGTPPPPVPLIGNPLTPAMHQFCRLVDE